MAMCGANGLSLCEELASPAPGVLGPVWSWAHVCVVGCCLEQCLACILMCFDVAAWSNAQRACSVGA